MIIWFIITFIRIDTIHSCDTASATDAGRNAVAITTFSARFPSVCNEMMEPGCDLVQILGTNGVLNSLLLSSGR